MTNRKYIDFNLQLQEPDSVANEFNISVLPSTDIEGTRESIVIKNDFDELHYELEDLENKKPNSEDLIKLGKKLADRLLPLGKIRELFQAAISKAGSDGGVRLRLWINGHKLAQIPWEYTYLSLQEPNDGEDMNNFLVLNPKVSLVRHENLEGEYPSLQAKTPNQLSFVMTFANVQDKNYRPLKLDKEKTGIEKVLQEFEQEQIKIEWESCENVTVDSLRTTLQKKKPNIFHFAGHGDFVESDVDKGMGGIILLENLESKSPHFFPADALARELSEAGVRVAILGACRTGRRDGVSAWTGVAPALIKMGIPIVVAMQYEVGDDHAVAFSKWFYTSLSNGLSIDEAVVVARRAMLDVSTEDNLEWGVPVVYMRSRDSTLISLAEGQQQSETSDTLRLIANADVKTIRGSTFTLMKVGEITKANLAEVNLKADLVENSIFIGMDIKNA
jgi:CHAT domain